MRYLFFLFFALCLTPVFSAEPDEKLHLQCLYPTVRLRCPPAGDFGTGFIVRSTKVGDEYHNVVVTAQHVVVGSPIFVDIPKYHNWSTLMGYTTLPCATYMTNPKMDLAVLLFVSQKEQPCTQFAFDSKLYIGSPIFKIGYGLGDDGRLDYGQVTSRGQRLPGDPILHMRINATTIFGDSGGPVFEDYKVVGVLRAVRHFKHMQSGLTEHPSLPLPNIAYFVPVEELKTWDRNVNNALGFVYIPEKNIPVIPFFRLWLNDRVIKEIP